MNIQSDNLRQAILKTIAYFDIFDYPLTQFEVHKWLYQPSRVDDPLRVAGWQNHEGSADGQDSLVRRGGERLSDVINKLDQLVAENNIQTYNGFYFLPGRTEIVKTRMDRYNIAEIKYKKAVRLVKFLSIIPHIKMIAVCNTLGYSNSRKQADIDLFIITVKNRIWLARLFSVFFLKILGLRPKGKKMQDKFCLSFFVSEDKLNIKDLTIGDEDIYFQYWLTQLVPVYNIDNTYENFLDVNKWIKAYLPNSIGFDPALRRKVKNRFKLVKKVWAKITFDLDEKVARIIQEKILPKNLKEIANNDKRVIINNQVLKFHHNDRRDIYRDLWQRKVASL